MVTSALDSQRSLLRHTPALVAQWIERFSPKEDVGGSIPLQGTTLIGRFSRAFTRQERPYFVSSSSVATDLTTVSDRST